ncbi:MAG: zinc protease [Armatimonadota bacterium]|nr:MAG: zinc protease [Armatimonadota bacterium]
MSVPPWEGYQVRVHPRARRVRIRVDAQGRVVVTVPLGFDPGVLPQILHKQRAWILARQDALRARKEAEQGTQHASLPDCIQLAALGQCVPLIWQPDGASGRAILREEDGRLRVLCDIRNDELCRVLLRRWVMRKAWQVLPSWLDRVACETGLSYAGCSVNSARTRWGSCSRMRKINLSARLLFVPSHLVRHVMIHELCHTVHLNHSERFYELVRSFDPDYASLRAELRDARRLVPLWMEM